MSGATAICNFLGSGGTWGIAWDGWSALATAAATIVALAVPTYLADKEAKRQNEFREKALNRAVADRKAVIREVCSAVDQILAYHETVLDLAKHAFPYIPAHQSFERIKDNTATLVDVLSVLINRPELSDGALFSATAAKRVATVIIENSLLPQFETNWPLRVARLDEIAPLAKVITQRVKGVRKEFELQPSTMAAKIHDKYRPAIADMANCLLNQEVPKPINMDDYI